MRASLALLVVLGGFVAPVAAQDAVDEQLEALLAVPEAPAIPPGEDTIDVLMMGQDAPYQGMILNTDTAIRWTNALRWWPEAFRLRMEQVRETYTALEHSYGVRLRIVEESYGREIEGLRTDLREQAQRYAEEIADLRHEEFYESWGFAFVMGMVVTGLLVGASVAIGVYAAP